MEGSNGTSVTEVAARFGFGHFADLRRITVRVLGKLPQPINTETGKPEASLK